MRWILLSVLLFPNLFPPAAVKPRDRFDPCLTQGQEAAVSERQLKTNPAKACRTLDTDQRCSSGAPLKDR